MILKSSYWVASHITGIFSIFKNGEDKRFWGSKGAGFSINRGVITTAERNIEQTEPIVSFDGRNVEKSKTEISYGIIHSLVPKQLINQVRVNHNFQIPIGAGFGASAAGALGLAFALNDIFKLKYENLHLWQVAHLVEVECGSGLGDILGLYHGGEEIRLEPGAPDIGRLESFNNFSDQENLVTVHLGELATRDILTSKTYQKRIQEVSNRLIPHLKPGISFNQFLHYSNEFTNELMIFSDQLKNLMYKLDELNIISAQIMLGEGLFFLIPKTLGFSELQNYLGVSKDRMSIEKICRSTLKKLF